MLEAAQYIRLEDGADPSKQTSVAQYDDDGVPTDLRLYSAVPADKFGEAPEKAFCGIALAAGRGYRGFICVFYFDAGGALVGS